MIAAHEQDLLRFETELSRLNKTIVLWACGFLGLGLWAVIIIFGALEQIGLLNVLVLVLTAITVAGFTGATRRIEWLKGRLWTLRYEIDQAQDRGAGS